MMGHPDAQVVLGDDDDAHGDENTLAVAPGALGELGIDHAIAASLAERQPHHPSPQDHASAPAFPPPPFGSQGAMGAAQQQQPQSQPQQPVPSWQGEAAQSYRNPPQQPMGGGMGMQQGYDPMLPQGHQSSPGMQNAQQQGYPMQAPYAQNGPPMGGGQMQPMPAPQWMQAGPPANGGGFAKKFTPQVIMLIVVGAVCLSIFIVGIVLFVTTNFQRP
jgi:hypothetical protein